MVLRVHLVLQDLLVSLALWEKKEPREIRVLSVNLEIMAQRGPQDHQALQQWESLLCLSRGADVGLTSLWMELLQKKRQTP